MQQTAAEFCLRQLLQFWAPIFWFRSDIARPKSKANQNKSTSNHPPFLPLEQAIATKRSLFVPNSSFKFYCFVYKLPVKDVYGHLFLQQLKSWATAVVFWCFDFSVVFMFWPLCGFRDFDRCVFIEIVSSESTWWLYNQTTVAGTSFYLFTCFAGYVNWRTGKLYISFFIIAFIEIKLKFINEK